LLKIRCAPVVIKEPPTECETNPVVVPPPKLPSHLERVLRNGRGADVTLLVGGRDFRAHRFMLAVRSPVFNAQLFGPMTVDKDKQHIEVDDMEPAIFEMLLLFIYMDSLPPCNENKYDVATMQHLLVAADRYGLDILKVMCENELCKSIDIKNVKSTLALASQHYCDGLKNACLEFMSTSGVAAVVFLMDGFNRLMGMARPTPQVLEENLEDKVTLTGRK
jgi:speckle-type POZ protein